MKTTALVLLSLIFAGCADQVDAAAPAPQQLACPTPQQLLDPSCASNPSCVELSSHPEVSYTNSEWNGPECATADWSQAITLQPGYSVATAVDGPTVYDCTYVYRAIEQTQVGDVVCQRVVYVLFQQVAQ